VGQKNFSQNLYNFAFGEDFQRIWTETFLITLAFNLHKFVWNGFSDMF